MAVDYTKPIWEQLNGLSGRMLNEYETTRQKSHQAATDVRRVDGDTKDAVPREFIAGPLPALDKEDR